MKSLERAHLIPAAVFDDEHTSLFAHRGDRLADLRSHCLRARPPVQNDQAGQARSVYRSPMSRCFSTSGLMPVFPSERIPLGGPQLAMPQSATSSSARTETTSEFGKGQVVGIETCDGPDRSSARRRHHRRCRWRRGCGFRDGCRRPGRTGLPVAPTPRQRQRHPPL